MTGHIDDEPLEGSSADAESDPRFFVGEKNP